MGTDSRISDATSSGTCPQTHDAVSTIDFGTLPAGTFGVTCKWEEYPGVVTVQADIRLSKSWYWVNAANGCTQQVDVQDLVTHEAGHAFGLLDVDSVAHEYLTMAGGADYCVTRDRTLGKGDILGLNYYDS